MNGTSVPSNGVPSNGVHDAVNNKVDGYAYINPNYLPRDSARTHSGFEREELVRIIVQAIDALGYSKSARCLEKEAQVESMSLQMRTLRDCVLLGRWDKLEDVLSQVTVFKSDDDARAARFVLYEQKFLELLEAGNTADALECLRNDLTRLSPDPTLLQKLPLLCMCGSPEEVRSHAKWPGAGPQSRIAVLEKLQRYIPPSELLQENRLEKLLCQIIEQQKQRTMYPYTKNRKISLLEDMTNCKNRIPRKKLHSLQGHADDVLYIQFSHNGEWLASASKDKTVIIWKVGALLRGEISKESIILNRLEGHADMISCISWSPDDSKLLTSSADQTARIWDIESAKCIQTFKKHTDQLTACVWMPSGRSVVSAGLDKNIYEWNSETGEFIGSFSASAHVNDITLSKDGRMLVATCSTNQVHLFNIVTRIQLLSFRESKSVTAIFLSDKADALLVCINANESPDDPEPEIHLWSIPEGEITRKFTGFQQTRFVIRACFGGPNEEFVISGSEDNHVHVWERNTGKLIARFSEHHGPVSTVSCSSINRNLFATGSDDNTVIVSPLSHLS